MGRVRARATVANLGVRALPLPWLRGSSYQDLSHPDTAADTHTHQGHLKVVGRMEDTITIDVGVRQDGIRIASRLEGEVIKHQRIGENGSPLRDRKIASHKSTREVQCPEVEHIVNR